MAQSIARNAFYNVLLNIASVIFPLITAPYVSRVLEPDGVGLFNFVTTYAGYYTLVALLGIPTYGVREVSKARDDKKLLTELASQLITIAAITTFCVTILYLISIFLFGQLTENYFLFLMAGFVVYLAPFKINWFYQGIEDFGTITKTSLFVRTLSVICLFIFVRDKGDLIIYVILNVLGSVIADMWNYIKMCILGIKPRLTLKGLKPHIKPIMVLLVSTIAISIYTILDTLMLGFMTNYEEVGYYTNAMHISRIIVLGVTSLSLVAVPRVSYYMKSKDYENVNLLMNKSFSVVTSIIFPVALGVVFLSPTFIPLFLGEKFEGSILPMIILSMLIIAVGLNNLTGIQILIGMGHDKLFMYSVLVGTISNVLLNWFLIPIWGAVGASIASVTAESLILIVTAILVYKYTTIRIKKWNDMGKAMLGTLFFIPLFLFFRYLLDGWWLVTAFVMVGAAAYFGIELLLGNESIVYLKSVMINKMYIISNNFKNR